MMHFSKRVGRDLFIFIVLSIILAIPIYYGLVPAPYRPQETETIHEITELPKFIAYQGTLGQDTPNTKNAMLTFLHSPINGMRLVVQLTKDNIPVIFNDERLETLTNGTGSIRDYLYSDLEKLLYKNSKDNVISLNEVFNLIGNQKYLFLEIKDLNFEDNEQVQAISSLIRKYQLHETVIIESTDPLFLYHYRKKFPFGKIMYSFTENSIASDKKSQLSWIFKQPFFQNWVNWIIKPDILGTQSSISKERLSKLIANGYPLIVWTVGDAKSASQLFAIGITGIESNDILNLYLQLKESQVEVVMDSSRSLPVKVTRFIIRDQTDISNALDYAKNHHLKVSIAGRRHSQGGHTFENNNVLLDMKAFNNMKMLDDNVTLRVQSGATWEHVQAFLNPLGRAVKIMQSDNIFTVGGTLSVNAHGWQVGSPPVSSTVKSFTIMLASNKILKCSRDENAELFHAALGGYGLFGVILEVDLETVPNTLLQSHQWIIKSNEYPEYFEKYVTQNPNVELAYGRLSIDNKNLLDEAILMVFERNNHPKTSNEPIQDEKFVAIKQNIFRNSQRDDVGKKIRWELEKKMNTLQEGSITSRNNIMSPDVHTLWPLDLSKVDILQEYFIPKNHFNDFLSILKQKINQHDINLLNVTIREVRKDNDTLLNYAKNDVFAFVLFFSQDKTQAGEKSMEEFTKDLITDVLKIDGTFYLPYRPHYTFLQIEAAYPHIQEFLSLKNKYDPQLLFSSQFYDQTLNAKKTQNAN